MGLLLILRDNSSVQEIGEPDHSNVTLDHGNVTPEFDQHDLFSHSWHVWDLQFYTKPEDISYKI